MRGTRYRRKRRRRARRQLQRAVLTSLILLDRDRYTQGWVRWSDIDSGRDRVFTSVAIGRYESLSKLKMMLQEDQADVSVDLSYAKEAATAFVQLHKYTDDARDALRDFFATYAGVVTPRSTIAVAVEKP